MEGARSSIEEDAELAGDFAEERRKLQEEDKQLASFAGLRADASGEPHILIGDFPLLWDHVLNVRRVHLPEGASCEQVEGMGMERLKEELLKLGLKCGGSLQERALRMMETRGLDGLALQALLKDRPDLVAGPSKKKNRDESARLREEKEQKRQRCTQGPLMPGFERKPGQKRLPPSSSRSAGHRGAGGLAEHCRTTSGPGPDF
mmetsp:Transcript_20971/g.49838  ORF Transcript_20971/g.49838 Transcript_20971/m.49838 type:complete len:204 (+) Transcript_20971:75-686(+)